MIRLVWQRLFSTCQQISLSTFEMLPANFSCNTTDESLHKREKKLKNSNLLESLYQRRSFTTETNNCQARHCYWSFAIAPKIENKKSLTFSEHSSWNLCHGCRHAHRSSPKGAFAHVQPKVDTNFIECGACQGFLFSMTASVLRKPEHKYVCLTVAGFYSLITMWYI